MEPIKFKEHNAVYAEDQPQYKPLPVFKYESKEGECVSCWKLSWGERFKIFFTGKLWVSLMTFNKPLTPSLFTVNKKDVL